MATAPLIEAAGLSAGYGKLAAIRDVDIEVGAGEVVVLLGSNGAGKTTTMRTLAGALRPMSGEVRWQGTVTTAPVHRRARAGLSYVPQDRSVVMGLTVAENLRVATGSPSRVLELFPELQDHLGRKAGLLSGGQQQMLTLGRALSSDPKVLLADELSLGLAPLVVQRLFDVVIGAAAEGTGILIVEQHARAALAVADRVYVMQRGRIVLSGTAEEINDRLEELEAAYHLGPRGRPDEPESEE